MEPTVVIYGEFGMLEDVAYITPKDPKFFTNQSPSIEKAVRLILKSLLNVQHLQIRCFAKLFGNRGFLGLFS